MSVRPPEQDALVNMGSKLNNALSSRSNPDRLGAAVAAKGMISKGALSDICGTNYSPFRKVMKIMDAVAAHITLAGPGNSRERITKKFNEFILILHNELDLTDVAQELAEECKRLNPSYNSPLSSQATTLSGMHGSQGVSAVPALDTRTFTDSPEKSNNTNLDEPDVPGTNPPAASAEMEEEDAEKPTYDDAKITELSSKHRPDNKRMTGEELRQIQTFCKEEVEIILQTVNENEYKAALTFMHPPPRENFTKPVVYPKPGMVVGIFAEQKTALVKTEPGLKCRAQLEKAVKVFPKAKYIVCVGVGYAFDKNKCKLADVLVANKICDFSDSKFDKDNEVEDRGQIIDVMQDLRDIFCNILYYEPFKVSDTGRPAKIHCGSICSYPALFDNQEMRDKFRRQVPTKAIGGEMEGGVLIQLQREEKIKGVIVVKGVSDYGDGKKKKDWQFTAAMAALHYVEEKLAEPNYSIEDNTESEEKPAHTDQDASLELSEVTQVSAVVPRKRHDRDEDASLEESATVPKKPRVQANTDRPEASNRIDPDGPINIPIASAMVEEENGVPSFSGAPTQREVTKALKGLDNSDLNSLGTELGLDYTRVKNMEKDKLNDMVRAWLKGIDQVKKPPTWAHLVTALQEMGHNGVAEDIKQKL